MAFRIGFRRLAQSLHRAAQANGAQYIRQASPRCLVITDVVGGEQPRAGRFRQRCVMRELRCIIAQQGAGNGDQWRQGKAQPGQAAQSCGRDGRDGGNHLAFRCIAKCREIQPAFILGRGHARCRKQGRQPPIGSTICGPDQPFRAIFQPQPATRREGEPSRLGRAMRAHHACQAIGITKPKADMAKGGGLFHQFLRVRGAIQEGKIGPRRHFRIAGQGHGKSPCTTQRPPAWQSHNLSPEASCTR